MRILIRMIFFELPLSLLDLNYNHIETRDNLSVH